MRQEGPWGTEGRTAKMVKFVRVALGDLGSTVAKA